MDNKTTLTIIQHNTLNWASNKHNLTDTYKQINPDIILLNSHGLPNNEQINIKGYNSYIRNSSNQKHDGSAILIKTNKAQNKRRIHSGLFRN